MNHLRAADPLSLSDRMRVGSFISAGFVFGMSVKGKTLGELTKN